MWPFLDPIECRQAEQCLAAGQPLEAARILLAARPPDHKAIREMLLRVGPALVESAQRALAAGDRPVAAEFLDCASQCIDLPAEVRVLAEQVARELDEQRRQQDWAARRLAQAEHWARDGRLRSALGFIEPLADDPPAARRRLDWQQDIERLDRHAAEFREHLARGEFPAAAAVLEKARELAPNQPLVLCLQQEFDAACPTAEPEPPASNSCRTDALIRPPRSSRLLLSGLSHSGDLLILPQPLITIGSPQDATIELPIQALLQRRHALLIRERSPGPSGECHRLVPLAGASVWVNERRLADSETVWLAHGDLLQFGPEVCQWRYRRPVADSATAMLQQSRPGGAAAVVPDSRPIARLVLLADDLRIGRQPRGNHLVESDFPVERLWLSVADDEFQAAVEGGVLFVHDSSGSDDPARRFLAPAELQLYSDDPALTEQALQGRGGDFRRTLKLVNL